LYIEGDKYISLQCDKILAADRISGLLLLIEMRDATYDVIGESYNRNRVADRRILQTIVDLLSLPAGLY